MGRRDSSAESESTSISLGVLGQRRGPASYTMTFRQLRDRGDSTFQKCSDEAMNHTRFRKMNAQFFTDYIRARVIFFNKPSAFFPHD